MNEEKCYFLNIDTLYLGIECDFKQLNDFIKKIKNYLFFLENRTFSTFCRNRFYYSELSAKEFGFFIFSGPRSGCKNDYVTIQLGGLFFRFRDLARQFIDDIFETFESYVRFQRVDVALDVCYKQTSDIISHFKENFPNITYSGLWKNRKIDFNYFGRSFGDNDFYFNMISQGKNDIRVRVYDKSFELEEKDSNYQEYYFLSDFDYKEVFRIEGQFRGDKLKAFVSDCLTKGYPLVDYDSICFSLLFYLLYKYDFKGIDKEYLLGEDWFIGSFNSKYDSYNLTNKIEYNKKMMLSYYKKLLDNYSELTLREEEKKELFIFKRNNPLKHPYNYSYEELMNLDLEKEKSNIPF